MARINNRTKYPNDDNLSENDFIIGSDGDNANITKTFSLLDLSNYIQGKIFENSALLEEDTNLTDGDLLLGTDVDDNNTTKNYSLERIAIYVSQYLFDNNVFDPVIQNNLVRTIDLVPEAAGNNNVWEVVNNRATFTVGQDEIFIFRSPYLTNGVQTNGYFILKSGARNYGLGQTLTTSDDFFLLRLEDEVVKTSQLVNDGDNGTNPFIHQTDNTSLLTNDGDDGVNPYVSQGDNTSLLVNNGANGINPYVSQGDNTSLLVNNGDDGINPYVSQGDNTSLLVNNGANGINPYVSQGDNTSLLINDGDDGVNPFITLQQVTDSKLYIKDNSLIIPSEGHWINGLDFAGASNTSVRVRRFLENSRSASFDFTVEGGLFFNNVGTVTKTSEDGFITLIFTKLSNNRIRTNYDVSSLTQFPANLSNGSLDFVSVSCDFYASAALPNYVSVVPVITSSQLNFLFQEILPADGLGTTPHDIVRISSSYYESRSLTGLINIDLSVGGSFSIPSTGFGVIDSIDLQITGGTTSGTYKIF